MKKNLKYSALTIILLSMMLNSGCSFLFGFNIVGTWFMEVTGGGTGYTWVIEFTGSKNEGAASTEALGFSFTGTFTRSGKTVTIELSATEGTITADWTFSHEDRASGTAIVTLYSPAQTLNFNFNANRRNF